jgi:hypothetical protein
MVKGFATDATSMPSPAPGGLTPTASATPAHFHLAAGRRASASGGEPAANATTIWIVCSGNQATAAWTKTLATTRF